MLCAAGRPLRLTTWLVLPFLFGGAVLGLTGLGGLLLRAPWPLALSSPLFGAGAAVTLVASGTVAWTSRRQRTWLRWSYPALVLALGVALDGVLVPLWTGVLVGVPVTALLVAHYVVERRHAPAPAEPGFAASC
ncbi:hypothetical protein [Saccharothrix sp. Mg75]|uniref:hypothetical protein n=1 Tax=Saccharothrix sp. Mg75 TaxID=3445357 RepID=UPI003EEFDD95